MKREEFEKASKVFAELNDAKEFLDILSVWDKHSDCPLRITNVGVGVCEDDVPSVITLSRELTPIVLTILRERTEKILKKLQNKFEKL